MVSGSNALNVMQVLHAAASKHSAAISYRLHGSDSLWYSELVQ